MGEELPDMLSKVADVLRWLGKHDVANAMTLLGRWLRAEGVLTLDELEGVVDEAEERAFQADDSSDGVGV